MGAFLRKYGTGTGADLIIPMVKAGSVDHAVSADWTPASGDVKVSKDGGAAANIGTLPTYITSIGWKFVFSDTELQCARLNVQVTDSATKAVEDQHFIVETYGHASAQHRVDMDSDAFSRAVDAITIGTVDTGATTTSIPTSSLSPAASVTDQFKGQILAFDKNTATAALRGQKTDITGSTSGGTLTVTALTTAPASGDTFTIQ